MSVARQKGTAAETAVVNYLRDRGFVGAERRALKGGKDEGDITGLGPCCLEVKACKTMDLAGWLDELIAEKANARAEIGAVWAKRRGKGSPGDWYVIMTGDQFTDILLEWAGLKIPGELAS